jgi:hypothetical protein
MVDTVLFEGCELCLLHERDPKKLRVIMNHTVGNCRNRSRQNFVYPKEDRLQLPADDSCIYCWLCAVDGLKRKLHGQKFDWDTFRRSHASRIKHSTSNCSLMHKDDKRYYSSLRPSKK